MKISSEILMNLLTPSKTATAAREERLAAAAEAKVREARTAMEALTKRRAETSDQRKAAARQKIEQLKARLQMLQSMASSDPKGTARLAAQLARELKAAVKEYSAGGGGSGLVGADAATPAPAAGAAPAGGAVVSTEAPAQTGDAAVSTTASGSETETPGEDDDGGKSANPYQQAIDQQQARTAEFGRRTAEAQADQEFLGEARRLAAQIKALVRNAADRSPGEEGSLSPDEAKELKAAVAEMDRQIETAQGDLGGSISILI